MSIKLRNAAALARDWLLPGDALAQWTHFVTSTCNAKCAHCFYPINQKNNELTLDEIDKLTKSMPRIRLLLISGGEPLLRRDLPEIIQLYFERTRFFNASIPTNGYSPDAACKMVEKICANRELQLGISVSIDGLEAYHDRVRAVPGLYKRALATLEALLALQQSLPNLTVGVTTVFMRDNQHEMEQLLDHIHDRYRPNHHGLGLIRGNPLGDASLKDDLDIDLYERLSRTIDERYPSGAVTEGLRGMRVRIRREINRQRFEYIARQARGGGFEQFCLAGKREYVMSETGDVYGCELIGDKLGNIRDFAYDFRKLRSAEAAAAFNRAKVERQCKCTHECNVRTMLLFNRGNAVPVAKAVLRGPN